MRINSCLKTTGEKDRNKGKGAMNECKESKVKLVIHLQGDNGRQDGNERR